MMGSRLNKEGEHGPLEGINHSPDYWFPNLPNYQNHLENLLSYPRPKTSDSYDETKCRTPGLGGHYVI